MVCNIALIQGKLVHTPSIEIGEIFSYHSSSQIKTYFYRFSFLYLVYDIAPVLNQLKLYKLLKISILGSDDKILSRLK